MLVCQLKGDARLCVVKWQSLHVPRDAHVGAKLGVKNPYTGHKQIA